MLSAPRDATSCTAAQHLTFGDHLLPSGGDEDALDDVIAQWECVYSLRVDPSVTAAGTAPTTWAQGLHRRSDEAFRSFGTLYVEPYSVASKKA
jgi:hypothetical protein